MAPPDDDQLPSRCPFLVLDTDAMSEVFKHVPVKVALRMTCHAAKAGHPECTKGHVADVVGHWASFRLAMDFGLDIQKHGGAIVQQATKGGNLYVLTKAIELGAVWDPMHVLWFAAEHGHLHMLRWLVASHLKEEVVGKGSWYSNILRVAARSGQFKIVQWCIDNNWDICLPETATSAVKSGSLAIVKLLDEKYGNSMDEPSARTWSFMHREVATLTCSSGRWACMPTSQARATKVCYGPCAAPMATLWLFGQWRVDH